MSAGWIRLKGMGKTASESVVRWCVFVYCMYRSALFVPTCVFVSAIEETWGH